MKTTFLNVLALCGLFLACTPEDNLNFAAEDEITMQKTVCFGTCPVYTFSIKGNGEAQFVGEMHVDKIGTYRKQFSAEETEALFRAFLQADFFAFKDEYTAEVTDLPTTYVTFKHGEREKKVKDYYEPPQTLVDLEERVAALAQTTEGWEKAADALPVSSNDGSAAAQQIEYGRYLVEIGGCHDCHSPKVMTEMGPVPDPKRLLSGHPADEKLAVVADPNILKDYALFSMGLTAGVGPWGTSFAANLTPDETGLGLWSYENFERALREGKSKGLPNGRMLLPPMPWPNLVHMKPADMQAIWAYLRSLPPVKNVVPAPIAPANAPVG